MTTKTSPTTAQLTPPRMDSARLTFACPESKMAATRKLWNAATDAASGTNNLNTLQSIRYTLPQAARCRSCLGTMPIAATSKSKNDSSTGSQSRTR
jgi:hypothetical protein